MDADKRFWKFVGTARPVMNVSKAIGTWYEGDPDPQPGRVYEGDLHIFQLEDGRYHLIIENTEYVGELEPLERQLFDWAVSAGNIEVEG